VTRVHSKLARYRNNPKNVTFDELKALLESFGFEVKNYSGGSHFSVSHPKYEVFQPMEPKSIPMKKPHVLEVYVRRATEWIDRVVELQKETEEGEPSE